MLLPCHAALYRDYILNDECRMTMTKQIRMTKSKTVHGPLQAFCHSGFVIPSSFDIRASSFCYHILSGTLIPSRSNPRCKTRAVRSHNAKREPRAGSSDFRTGHDSSKVWKVFAK